MSAEDNVCKSPASEYDRQKEKFIEAAQQHNQNSFSISLS